MDNTLKVTRHWLTSALRDEFTEVINKAKITPRQHLIAELKFCQGLYDYQIAMKLNLSPDTVKRELNKLYIRVARTVFLR